MNIKALLKKTYILKNVYVPYMSKKSKERISRRHELFEQKGFGVLRRFVEIMNPSGIPYWLEFGTLLGVYRDNAFVPNELDLDVGAPLEKSSEIYRLLINGGFRLVREFHVIGDKGLEQTYELDGITIDVMYFYEDGGYMYCTGAVFDYKDITGVPMYVPTTSHKFSKFCVSKSVFNKIEVFMPNNVEEHLIEIFGQGFRKYDPNFKGDLNKTYYSIEEKKSIGFASY